MDFGDIDERGGTGPKASPVVRPIRLSTALRAILADPGLRPLWRLATSASAPRIRSSPDRSWPRCNVRRSEAG
jgi:hypothetical protein